MLLACWVLADALWHSFVHLLFFTFTSATSHLSTLPTSTLYARLSRTLLSPPFLFRPLFLSTYPPR